MDIGSNWTSHSIWSPATPLLLATVIPYGKDSYIGRGLIVEQITSFLISTPITGVDSIFATYSLFGLFFTIYRVVTSMIIAIVVGAIENISNRRFNPNISFHENPSCSGGCCSHHNEHSGRSRFNIKSIFDYAFNTIFRDMSKPLLIGLIIGAFSQQYCLKIF